MAQLNDLLVMGQSTLLGPVTIQNNITISGTLTLTKATDTSVDADNRPALIVGGSSTSTHIEIDCNEVLAKSNGTTETDLYLGTTSSKVHIGQNTVGSTSNPIYLNSGAPVACSSTIGGNTTPIYMSSGTLTASTATIGGAASPVYMSSGNITACSMTASGNRWGVLTQIGGDGVMEVGKYIDFHTSDNDTSDYGARLTCDSSSLTSSIQIQAPTFKATSDKRLKENISFFEPKKSILDLPIYKFDFIAGAKNQIGCIAQDLQKFCPEIVSEDDNGYLSIQESKIVYLLIDEVKKLKEEIKQLKGSK